MFKKGLSIIPAILSVSLLAFPATTLAGVSGSVSTTVTVPAVFSSGGGFSSDSGNEQKIQPTVNLDKAISIFKQAFTVPDNLTNFSSGFSRFMNRQAWDLHWMNRQNPPSGLDAQVDATTGEIISMRVEQFVDSQAPGLQIPTLTEQDAEKVAIDLLTRLDSDKMPELKLQKGSDSALSLNNFVVPLYSFYYQRTINNIPFLGDGVTIQVNGNNGQVMFFNQNWTPVSAELPDVQKAISSDKAREIFQNSDMLQLQYFQARAYLPYGNAENPEQVKLVYAPNSKYINGAIDALSGEPVPISEGSFNSSWGAIGWGPIYRGSGPFGGSQEQEESDNTALISQDAALKIATKWVELPKDAVFQNASLNTGWMKPNQKVWNLTWGPDPEKVNPGQMFFISATIDAVSGDLLSFNSSPQAGESPQAGSISREQALQIVQEFLQKIQPKYYAQVKLRDDDSFVKIPGQNGLESFNFYRTANDIPFMNDGFNVTVDMASKRILNYNFSWSDTEFPAADGVLKSEQANAAYLKGNPLVLSFVQMYNGNKPGQVKLVYVPKPNSVLPWGAGFVDANNGAMLGWDGKDISSLPKSRQFKDISGNFAEKEINLLGQAGLFGDYDDQFKPSEDMKTLSLARALLGVQTGVWSTYLQSDPDILKAVRKLGWIDQDVRPDAPVDRAMLAQIMIHYLKLDNIAQLKDAFQDPYVDKASFPPGTEGYIALGRALGLFHFDDDQFKPEQTVTRAEAAYALIQAIAFERQGTGQ